MLYTLCLCSLSFPACTDHAPYYTAICSVSGFTIFFTHYCIDGTIFGKKIYSTKKYVFWFPPFLIFRRIRRDITINAQTPYCNVTLFLIGSWKTLIFATDIHLSILYFNSCRPLPETKRHSSLFLHWSGSKFSCCHGCLYSFHSRISWTSSLPPFPCYPIHNWFWYFLLWPSVTHKMGKKFVYQISLKSIQWQPISTLFLQMLKIPH